VHLSRTRNESNDQLAFAGNYLQPFDHPYYRFLNRATGDVTTNLPGVSYNSVMRDDNDNYPNNRVKAVRVSPFGFGLTTGTWEVAASYTDKCGRSFFNVFLGYVVVP
jgi:hypothetical protein